MWTELSFRHQFCPQGTYRHNFVVQLLSHVWLFVTPWNAARQASLSFTISQSLLKLMFIESVMPSNHLMLCRSLLLPSIFPASGSFLSFGSSQSVAKVLELQLQHQFFQWIFRIDFFRIDCFERKLVGTWIREFWSHGWQKDTSWQTTP